MAVRPRCWPETGLALRNKPPLLLVHGAWHGGWCWGELARELEHRGHPTYAPTLSGLGHRPPSPDINADTHVDDVVQLVEALDLQALTLVLHSYAGLLGGALLHRLRPRLVQIAWIEAVLPTPGQSLLDLLPPAASQRYRQAAIESGGWLLPPPDVAQFQVPLTDLASQVARRLTPQPFCSFAEAISAPQADVITFPGRYLLASDRDPQPYAGYAERARAAGWPVKQVTGGHLLMLTNTQAVADFLV